MHPFQSAIQKAIDLIKHEQLSDGSFKSISGPDLNNLIDSPICYRTTFTTSNILLCIDAIDTKVVNEIKNKGIKFLLKQKGEICSFNYWSLDSKERSLQPYPDDLDDTCAALSAIHKYDASLITGSDLANVVKVLITNEMDPGGPFKTWIVKNDVSPQWYDVDPIVNSTIGYFLAQIGVHIPAIEKMLSRAIQDDNLISPYYPTMHQFFYFVSRFYRAQNNIEKGSRELITKKMLSNIQKHGCGQNILEKAMTLSSFANLNIDHPLSAKLANDIADELETYTIPPPSAFV